ncbi:MAG TPA: bifunctional diguanylate cyclase/phosphodiesterase [Trebonia sp.]|nr:bifunctional diguanylate cyclase/phosphodiesterase [Trebonia sp.]
MSDDWSRNREGTLRLAGAALAREPTIEGIAAIVRTAVRDLIGQRPNCEALFAVRDDEELRVVATSFSGQATSEELAGLVPHLLPRMRLQESDEPRLVRAADLNQEERAAAARAGFESLLLCPLVLTDRPSGDPLIGALAVVGGHEMLSELSSAVGILATQVALALERVTLSEEVMRQRDEALFRTLVQDARDVIMVLDEDMTVKYASPSATRLYGDIPIEGARVDTLASDFEHVAPDEAAPAGSRKGYQGRWRITRHDGQRLEVEAWISDLRHEETVRGLVLTVRNVTEESKLEDQLKYQAFHDTLTGLPNRALFADWAGHALMSARAKDTTAAVLFVDLDDFKVVNDTMGHAVGDELLASVAGRLAAVSRKSDTAFRLGGDEFALLIEDLSDPAAVEGFADRVVKAFSEPFELSAGHVPATITVGVSTTQDSSDVGELLRHADMSLYAAKSEGKRSWRRYTHALSTGVRKRRELQQALEDALAQSAFTLAYQPIVALATGAIHGFEALLRWPQPVEGTTVPPAELVELAEETGLIMPLGWWILEHAITDLARLRDGMGQEPGKQEPCVTVNVSCGQFRDPGFADRLRGCLEETGLVPSAVVLELTESSMLRRDERVTAALSKLRDIGVRLAIDDFGTGYASPSSVLELPIDALKIDKSFVDGLTEPQGRKFAASVINFAHGIDVEVIAEGIETEQQRAVLTEMGCRLGQGYLLARPMDWRAAQELLLSGTSLPRQAP